MSDFGEPKAQKVVKVHGESASAAVLRSEVFTRKMEEMIGDREHLFVHTVSKHWRDKIHPGKTSTALKACLSSLGRTRMYVKRSPTFRRWLSQEPFEVVRGEFKIHGSFAAGAIADEDTILWLRNNGKIHWCSGIAAGAASAGRDAMLMHLVDNMQCPVLWIEAAIAATSYGRVSTLELCMPRLFTQAYDKERLTRDAQSNLSVLKVLEKYGAIDVEGAILYNRFNVPAANKKWITNLKKKYNRG